MGARARTLTGHSDRPSPFGYRVDVAPFSFDDPNRLAASLEGADSLYSPYWIRFAKGALTFNGAVARAGVGRLVHVSITNASSDSPLPYFRGKGQVEEAVRASCLSYAILRPTLVFGKEDILANNIARALRRMSLFGIFGSGDYRVQPIYVDDLAAMAAGAGQDPGDQTVDAVGPEVYAYEELVRLIAAEVGSRARIIHVSPGVASFLTRLLWYFLEDVVLTRGEIEGLMANLLVSDSPPTTRTLIHRLKKIYDLPPLLYVKGELRPEDERPVSVVGTRKPTAYGREAAYQLTYDLASAGVTIVSGLARGIDGTAHQAALEALVAEPSRFSAAVSM